MTVPCSRLEAPEAVPAFLMKLLPLVMSTQLAVFSVSLYLCILRSQTPLKVLLVASQLLIGVFSFIS